MLRRTLTLLSCLCAPGCRHAAGPPDGAGSLRIRTACAEYRPVEAVVVSTTNRTARTVYDDHCGEVHGLEYLRQWNGSYGMGRGCDWPDPAAWRTHSVAIPPGATHVDTLHVNGRAYTGTWRVVLTLRDAAAPRFRRAGEPRTRSVSTAGGRPRPVADRRRR